jgi:plastocyanin
MTGSIIRAERSRRRRRGATRMRLLGIISLILIVAIASAYIGMRYGGTGPGAQSSSGLETTVSGAYTRITIPDGAHDEPPGFNVTELLTGAFGYPFNFTVVIGVNSTVEWFNNDTVDHTVSSFMVPTGAAAFGSNLIPPKGEFSTTLAVPGVYKYTCIWHPWLAGEITVKPEA